MNHWSALMTAVAGVAGLMASLNQAYGAVVFNDNFTSTSTVNSASPASPTSTSTAYQLVSTKTWTPTPASTPTLKYGIASTSSGTIEAQALFTTTPITLATTGDSIEMTVTFTNTAGLQNGTANSTSMGFGLYNGSQVAPLAGGLNGTASSGNTFTGGVVGWQGYSALIANGSSAATTGTSTIRMRPSQPTTLGNNQDLVTTGSSSQSFVNGVTVPGSSGTGGSTSLGAGSVYTEDLLITLTGVNTLSITSNMYAGSTASGSPLSTMTGTASGSSYVTSTFDGLAVGWRETSSVTTTIDISNITVNANVQTVVPEPASLSILAMSGLGLLVRRSRPKFR
jgi:hypothetical protein